MIIAPNSNAKLLTGVPIDMSYNHTVWFNNIIDQQEFFNSYLKSPVTINGVNYVFSLTNLTNQRVERNYISVNIPYALLLDINYVMFQNTMYNSTKWFYAFVTNIEYVNTTTTNVYYEIDLIQTFLFDFTLQNVRVDREIVVDEGRRSPTTNMYNTSWGRYTVKDNCPFKPNTQTDFVKYTLLGDGSLDNNNNNGADFYVVFSYQSDKGILVPGYTITEQQNGDTGTWTRYINLNTRTSDGSFVCRRESRTVTGNYFFVYDSASALNLPAHLILNEDYVHSDLNAIIEKIQSTSVEGTITDITVIPKYLYHDINIFDTTWIEQVWQYNNITKRNFDYQIPSFFKNKSNLNYYTPKNGILYTSPYANIKLNDYSQNEITFLPEYITPHANFSSRSQIRCVTYAFLGQIPTCILLTENYNVANSLQNPNPNYSAVFNNSYEVPFGLDYYARWYSQNSIRINSINEVNQLKNFNAYASNAINFLGGFGGQAINTVLSKGRGAGNLITELSDFATNNMNAVVSNYEREQSLLQEISVAQNTPPTSVGSPSLNNVLVPFGCYGISYTYNTISGEECKIMDEFYSLYGYKLNVVKTPVLYDNTQLQKRKCWNYFKTSQCRLTRTENGANLNAGDEEMLQQIFDRGITFWSYADDVVIGDYSQDNPVVQK